MASNWWRVEVELVVAWNDYYYMLLAMAGWTHFFGSSTS
jgi:hypothetical protein